MHGGVGGRYEKIWTNRTNGPFGLEKGLLEDRGEESEGTNGMHDQKEI